MGQEKGHLFKSPWDFVCRERTTWKCGRSFAFEQEAFCSGEYVPSPRKDAVRTRMAPSGKRAPKARPMMVPCAVIASISIEELTRSGECFWIEEAKRFKMLKVGEEEVLSNSNKLS